MTIIRLDTDCSYSRTPSLDRTRRQLEPIWATAVHPYRHQVQRLVDAQGRSCPTRRLVR